VSALDGQAEPVGAPSAAGPGDERARRFEQERPRLVGLAYRMLASRADAEDVVQEAWLRYGAARAEPDNPAAWLTTVTTRLALDRLKSAPVRRERYVGPWLPEPVRTRFGDEWTALLAGDGHGRDRPSAAPEPERDDPAEIVDRAATLTLGFLVVLDTLSPEDRAVFLLADVFAVPFAEIAAIVGRSPDACRQAASRARRRIREAGVPRRGGATTADWDLAARLATAVGEGDLDATLRLLAPEITLVSDGGPNRHAARRPVVGPERVARFVINIAARRPEGTVVELAEINGNPALITRLPDEPPSVWTMEPGPDGRVAALRMVLAPEKLATLDAEPLDW
jgi:RNA polymerase sigma-70 factor (ECF subfamily)